VGEGGTEGKGKAAHELPEGDARVVGRSGVGINLDIGDRGGQRDAHALIATALWNCVELFLEGPCQRCQAKYVDGYSMLCMRTLYC
jgi:hypothetical protein